MSNSTLTLVLMAGLPGVGKSTLARKLGEKLDWYVVDQSGLMEHFLLNGLDEDVVSWKAYNACFEAIHAALKNGRSVILDTSALHPFILEEARAIVSNMRPAPVQLKVLFLVVADRKLRNERIHRRPSQTSVIRGDPSTIEDYLACYKHLPPPPGTFYLDTSKQGLEDNLSRSSYYLISDDAKYDDEEMLKKAN